MSYATEQGVLNAQWNAAEMAFQAEAAKKAYYEALLAQLPARKDDNSFREGP